MLPKYLRCYAVAFAAAMICAPSSAQNDESSNPPEKVTYFLLDTSGSMKSRISDAEHELALILASIIDEDPDAPLSRTEFRAANVTECATAIEIAEPRSAKSWPDPPSERTFSTNDFTPLGSALQAAIKSAGTGPAEIFLASDWAQSPNCGVSVAEALASLDPSADIAITPIAIRPTDSDLASARQSERSSDVIIKKPNVVIDRNRKARTGFVGGTLSFIEAWLWFVGFLLLSGLALSFGSRNTKLAIKTEAGTKEIKSLQRAVLYDENKNAEQELRRILAKVHKERRKALQLARHIKTPLLSKRSNWAKLKNWMWRWKLKLFGRLWPWEVIAGVVVSALLFILAAVPQNLMLFGFSFDNAKESAEGVLNSDFATAFAIIWIATIFFAASQYQRRKELDEEFALATDEAGWLALARDRQIRNEAIQQYNAQIKSLNSMEFQIPPFIPFEYEFDSDKIEMREVFRVVTSFAIELAAGNSLDEEHAPTSMFSAEAKRLDAFVSLQRRSGANFKKFVERLIVDREVGGVSSAWKELLEYWTIWPDPEKIYTALRKIQSEAFQ